MESSIVELLQKSGGFVYGEYVRNCINNENHNDVIKCYIHQEDLDGLIERLKENRFDVIQEDNKLIINFAVHPLIKEKINNMFENVYLLVFHEELVDYDFECNGLILNSENEYRMQLPNLTPLKKLERIVNVINDIKQKRTKIKLDSSNLIDIEDIKKIINDGYTIYSDYWFLCNEEYTCNVCKITKINTYHLKRVVDNSVCFECYSSSNSRELKFITQLKAFL